MPIKFIFTLFLYFLSLCSFSHVHGDSSIYQSEKTVNELIYSARLSQADSVLKIMISKADKSDLQTYLKLKNKRGYLLNRLSKFDSAMQEHYEVQKIAIRNDLEDIYYQTRFYIGLTKLFSGESNESRDIFEEARSYFLSQQEIDSTFLGRTLYNLGFIQFLVGNMSAAEQFLLSSNEYLSSSENQIYRIDNMNLLAGIYRRAGELNKSLKYYDMSADLYKEYNRTLDKTILYSGIANVYFLKNDDELGRKYLDSTLYIAKKNQNSTELSFAYRLLANRMEEKGMFKESLFYRKKFDSLLNAVQLREKALNIAQIEQRAENDIERLRMESLQKELELQKRSNRTQRAWIFFIILVCIYLLGSVIVFRKLIFQKNKTQQSLETKNKELEEKTRQIAMTQDRLIKSEKMALLGRISAGIAHELNTPIGAIKGNLELIDTVQFRELEMFRDISPYITKDEFDIYAKLVIAGSINAKRVFSREEIQVLKGKWDKLVPKKTKDRQDIIDMAVDMKLDYKPERYKPLFKNDYACNVFELALYGVNRYESIQTALQALKRVQKILGSFKTYSFKRGWEDEEEFNLKETIETLLSLHQNILKSINIDISSSGNLFLTAIPDELSQVWSNLITNAAYAMNYEGELNISLIGEKEEVLLTIEDSGGGIHVANKNDIFEPFFTTKPEGEGSGLGLDISKQIIQKHGGTITYENTQIGTKFTVVLPRNRELQEQRKVS